MQVVSKVCLDLACGSRLREGFEGVDLYAADAAHRVNLFKFPWPFDDDSVDELHCAHFIEHIPMCYVRGGFAPADENDRDMWCAFFDECWRILVDGGQMTVVVPHLQDKRAFQDPTHRRFISENNFVYLDRAWREKNGLTHYLGRANFGVEVMVDGEYAPQLWNSALDLHVRLTCRKPT